MNGIRPFAISIQRLFTTSEANCSREEFESLLVHKITQITPISPAEIGFSLDCLKQKEIFDETQDMNKSLDNFLETFKPESPKMTLIMPGLIHRPALSSPSMSSLRKRRITMINKTK